MKYFLTLVKAEEDYYLISFVSRVNFPWIIAPRTVDWTYRSYCKIANYLDSGDYIELDVNVPIETNYSTLGTLPVSY
jgi:hypothetical protein